tara:strand:- start:452 stop:892 length:441 start_codon:yes stop_codon:yes gene_type:complete
MDKYIIIPQKSKSIYKEQIWSGRLYNGRDIIVSIVDIYESGYFKMELSKTDLKKIMKKDNVVLNDYKIIFSYLEDKCGNFNFLRNISHFSENDINEINKLLYDDVNTVKDIRNNDFIELYDLENHWFTCNDIIYGIECSNCLYEKL